MHFFSSFHLSSSLGSVIKKQEAGRGVFLNVVLYLEQKIRVLLRPKLVTFPFLRKRILMKVLEYGVKKIHSAYIYAFLYHLEVSYIFLFFPPYFKVVFLTLKCSLMLQGLPFPKHLLIRQLKVL